MKRFFALLLSLTLLAGVFVGCTPDSASTQTDTSADASTDTDTNGSTSTQIKYENPQDVPEAAPHLVGLTDQKNCRLIVCDLAVEDWSRDAAVVWEFKDPRVDSAGIKFRYNEVFGGYAALFCGSKGAGIISYETKKMLYFTTRLGNNPHSVELLPDGAAHDLQPVYGQPDSLWVSTGSHIIQVNKKTGESSMRYEGWHMISATANVKGLGNFEDKTFVFARMANVWREWNTDTITVCHYNEEEGRYCLEPRKLPKGVAYYKLRVFKKDYL